MKKANFFFSFLKFFFSAYYMLTHFSKFIEPLISHRIDLSPLNGKMLPSTLKAVAFEERGKKNQGKSGGKKREKEEKVEEKTREERRREEERSTHFFPFFFFKRLKFFSQVALLL